MKLIFDSWSLATRVLFQNLGHGMLPVSCRTIDGCLTGFILDVDLGTKAKQDRHLCKPRAAASVRFCLCGRLVRLDESALALPYRSHTHRQLEKVAQHRRHSSRPNRQRHPAQPETDKRLYACAVQNNESDCHQQPSLRLRSGPALSPLPDALDRHQRWVFIQQFFNPV